MTLPESPCGVQRENAQRAEAQVAHRAVGDQLLHVLLHHADQRAVDDADDREHDQNGDDVLPRGGIGRQQRQREADESVGAHLQQNARQNHRAGRGRFGVRVGQPGVEREHRHLDGKGEEESPEQNRWKCVENCGTTASSVGMSKVNGRAGDLMRAIVKRQNRQQHQHRAGQRVEEELDRRVQPAVAAPDADQEVHRHQHHFPEQVEQEEIERHENAQHARPAAAGTECSTPSSRILIALQDERMEIEPSNVVSMTSRKLMPSMPSV